MAGTPPNLLWIMADDLGAGEPSFTKTHSAHGRISTPAIDSLAKDGMRFTAAYAGYTVCAPSRATLFTGRNSGRLAGAPADWPLLPRLLRQGGFETVAFGKSAPMDGPQPAPQPLAWGLPTDFGFETYAGQTNQALCHNMYPLSYTVQNTSVPLPLNTQVKGRAECMRHPERFNYTTDLFADHAIEWLRARAGAAASARPFFLYLSFTVPHAGGWGSAPEAPEQGNPVPTDLGYGKEDWPIVERDHAASVGYLDFKVGRVLAALREARLEERTVVFLASDNGAHNEGGHSVRFFNSTGGLRGFKRSYYEGGVRSPSLVRWPGVVAPGSVSSTPWAFWDVLPTMLEIARLPPPSGAILDGRSIVPTLRGHEQPPPPYMYWTWRGTVGWDERLPSNGTLPFRTDGRSASGTPPGYAVRVGEWKGVVHACVDQEKQVPSADDVMELYNLTADPYEASNVATEGDGPTIVRSIKAFLVKQSLSCACWQC
eukprot:CAMPEP_0119359116 /NCGR_PEP_ID=MMETSP1334-20130426/7087_1 /TAXON_ID=127549 /ORGANISM="Calcidiscus leptoporus, Strain RCC1130" /LENGTH=484 /DNA_ID=CAMNT_0007373723 /DNA_START=176 /DNA_END=1630 /DNA_ORIENTATION=-